MRDAKYRQLIALTIGLLPALPLCAQPPGPPPGDARLKALKLSEATLTDADQRRKLGAAYDQLVAENAASAAVLAARGDFRWECDEHRGAVEDWQAALLLEPTNAGALIGLGGAAVSAGEIAKAAALHRQAVTAQPQHALAHFALANVLYLFRHQLRDETHPDEQSVLQDALTHFAEAARLSPMNAEYARAFAETFYGLPAPDWPQARKAWEKVYDLSSVKDFALVNLARVDLHLGHFDAARRCLDQVQGADYQRVKTRLEARLPR